MPPKKSPTPHTAAAPARREETALDLAGAIAVPLTVALCSLPSILPSYGLSHLLFALGAVVVSLVVFSIASIGHGEAEKKLAPGAGFGLRFLAGLIDGLIFWIVVIFVVAVPMIVAMLVAEEASYDFGSEITIVLAFLFLVLQWLYCAGMESSSRQATLGKMALGLRVVGEDGGQISFGTATYRYFAEYLSLYSLTLGHFMALWSPKKAMLHDLVSRTAVVCTADDGATK